MLKMKNYDQEEVDRYVRDLDHEVLPHAELVKLREKAHSGDESAFQALWVQGTKLVLMVAHRLRRQSLVPSAEFLDLIQEGNIGVGKAVRSWDPDKGRFSTYVAEIVRGHMLMYTSGRGREGGVTGRDAEGNRATVYAESDILSSDNDGVEEVHENYLVSFDFSQVEHRLLRRAIAKLPEKEHDFIMRRFFRDQTLEEIADVYGISKQAVHKAITKIISTLRVDIS